MGNQVEGKDIAIIAHITLIGWVIALVMNSSKKLEFASYHIRQMLGLIIVSIVISFVSWIPIVGWVLALLPLVMWIVGLINAINGYAKPMPLLGKKFEVWFKSL